MRWPWRSEALEDVFAGGLRSWSKAQKCPCKALGWGKSRCHLLKGYSLALKILLILRIKMPNFLLHTSPPVPVRFPPPPFT